MPIVKFLDTRLNVPIDARRVLQLTNTMPSLTETEAQEWINTFLINFQNRAVTNLQNIYLLTNDILHQNDALAGNITATWTTLRSIRIDSIVPTPTTIRIFYEYRGTQLGGTVCDFRILRDTTQIGSIITSNDTTWRSVFIDVPDCNLNTIIHIQSRSSFTHISAEIRNFRILGLSHLLILREAINRRTAGATIAAAFTNTL